LYQTEKSKNNDSIPILIIIEKRYKSIKIKNFFYYILQEKGAKNSEKTRKGRTCAAKNFLTGEVQYGKIRSGKNKIQIGL